MNRDFYKDEFDNYHEVDEELEEPLDGLEDDEQDFSEEEENDLESFLDEDDEISYDDEDEAYINERRNEYQDIDED